MAQSSSTPTQSLGGTIGSTTAVLWLVLACAVVVLSAIGVLVCLLATIGVWVERAPLQEATAAGVARLDAGFGRAQELLRRVNSGLSTANQAELDPTLTTISATVLSVNSALQSLDNMPFVNVPTLDTDRLQVLAARAQSSLAAAAGAAQLAEARTAGLEEQVVTARAQLSAFGAAAARWIDRAAVALTLVLLWLALAQASLFRSAWRYTRSRA